MPAEFDNIGGLAGQRTGRADGTEQFEALSSLIAQIGGVPNVRLTINQIAAYVLGGLLQVQAGTSYTAVLTDIITYTRFTNGSSVIFMVLSSSQVPWVVGDQLVFEQAGAGAITPTAGAGVTISSRGGATRTAGQFGVAMLKYVGADTWILTGDLV